MRGTGLEWLFQCNSSASSLAARLQQGSGAVPLQMSTSAVIRRAGKVTTFTIFCISLFTLLGVI